MIQERAMLAAVHISIWTAVKHDRGVSRDVAERNGARWLNRSSICANVNVFLGRMRVLPGRSVQERAPIKRTRTHAIQQCPQFRKSAS